jgi:hypothetical protein
MSDSITSPSGPWDPGREMFNLSDTLSGRSDAGWGTIQTSDQKLSASVHATAFKLKSQNTKFDFYSLFGHFQHGIQHGNPPRTYDPAASWVSVGYYSSLMSLYIELLTDDSAATLWDSGPTSTVGSESTGFNIGGNLSGGMFGDQPIIQAGVSGSFGATFSSPSVKFAHAPVGHNVSWSVALPGVGHLSPGVPANPFSPSYAGYKWYFGTIYVVPKGKLFSVRIRPHIEWVFDWTRGIQNDKRTWSPHDDASTVYKYAGS